MLFEVPLTERGDLDKAEGTTDGGYKRCDKFSVRLVDGDETVTASTYLATNTDRSLQLYDWYLALVIAGASEHGLGEDYLATLRRVNPKPDPKEGRNTRIKAIEALTKAGFPDYRELLRQN